MVQRAADYFIRHLHQLITRVVGAFEEAALIMLRMQHFSHDIKQSSAVKIC